MRSFGRGGHRSGDRVLGGVLEGACEAQDLVVILAFGGPARCGGDGEHGQGVAAGQVIEAGQGGRVELAER